MEQRRTALVTGASRGIGKAIALRLAKDGCNVAVIYAGNEQAAKDTCAEIEALGVSSLCIRCDVSDSMQCAQAVAQTVEAFGGIDILVNNAGITRDGLLMSMKEGDFQKVINTNLNGAFYMIKHSCRQFIKRRSGRIINISSISGVMGNAGQANYAAAKAGLIGLTKTTAKELAGRNITCNAVAPGFIQTDMTAVLSDKVKAAISEQIPLGRMGDVQDIAAAVSFLASQEAGYITGQVLRIDGGLNM
ncbi:3-oxoacyl-[acyl-carrier-protein] reductase [uncultured Negativibacillus sp.]|uniref:3-oxoacyl-[acyl-carrier-protein] reductase n=1 Tax=uncultured Negativibacillus sp. TaxID=1980696 RepID=UPI0025DA14BA|nr:3-oxoacyl-[acyl-carrier-protein] reductase [uncultured Negativibacillus sp.]